MAKKKSAPAASESVVDGAVGARSGRMSSAPPPPIPDASKDSALVTTQATTFAAQAMILKVTDKASEQKATDLLLQLRSIRKEGKEKLDFLVKPLKEHVKRIEAEFKPGFEKLEESERQLGAKVLGWRQMEFQLVEKTRAEEARKADEAADRGDQKAALQHATAAVSAQGPARVTQASAMVSASVTNISRAQVGTQKRWTFEVVSLAKVPKEYLELDSVKVNAAVKSGLREIPGLRIFQKEGLTIGGM